MRVVTMERSCDFILVLFSSFLLVAGSSKTNYYYPPVYGDMGDTSSMMNTGYSESKSHTPAIAQKFEVHVYEVKPDGEMIETKSPPYKPPSYDMMSQPLMMSYDTPSQSYPSPMDSYEPPVKRRRMRKSYVPPKKVHKTQKCFQCEYRAPRPETYEIMVREPFSIRVPKTVKECTWEKSIDYVYQKPKPYSNKLYGHYETVPKWEKVCIPKTVYETRTKYKNRYITKKRIGKAGGFEACKGPIDLYSAKHSGVDDWECYNNCFIKMDKKGTISRGCYTGQYKVDPDLLGCHYQGDNKQDLYCFCEGDLCNGQEMPAPKMSKFMSYSMH